MRNKKAQYAIVFLLLFTVALIFYAVMFPEIVSIINTSRNATTDTTVILIYDILPFALGFMLLLGVIFSIAAIVNR